MHGLISRHGWAPAFQRTIGKTDRVWTRLENKKKERKKSCSERNKVEESGVQHRTREETDDDDAESVKFINVRSVVTFFVQSFCGGCVFHLSVSGRVDGLGDTVALDLCVACAHPDCSSSSRRLSQCLPVRGCLQSLLSVTGGCVCLGSSSGGAGQ